MAGADMNGPGLKAMTQREEMVEGREEAAGQREEEVKKREQTVKKREAVATTQEKAIKGREGALQEKGKAMRKWEELLKKKEEELLRREAELSKRAEALEKPEKQPKRIRASAAGSSSPPRQPPPPSPAVHIQQLPDNMLAKIFALLSLKTIVSVLSVCRRWRGVVEDRNCIKELVLEDGKVTTQEALCLIRSGQGLKSLELIRRSDTVALLDAASARCTNLLHLSVEFWNVSAPLTEALRNVFFTSPHIGDLCLRCISIADQLQFCQELGTALPKLRKLEFCIYSLSAPELDALVDSCSRNQMEEFKAPYNPCSEEHIAKMVQFWGRSLRVLELSASDLTDGALALLGGCSELRRLKLIWLPVRGDGLCGLAALSHLEELYVSIKTELEQEKYCRFFSRCCSSPGLRKLSLLGRYGVDDTVLASVAASCPQLEELEVTRTKVTISGVREVLRCCRKLHNLNVADTDASVAHIVPELPQLAPQLRRICIDSSAKDSLDEATLRHVQEQMPQLRID